MSVTGCFPARSPHRKCHVPQLQQGVPRAALRNAQRGAGVSGRRGRSGCSGNVEFRGIAHFRSRLRGSAHSSLLRSAYRISIHMRIAVEQSFGRGRQVVIAVESPNGDDRPYPVRIPVCTRPIGQRRPCRARQPGAAFGAGMSPDDELPESLWFFVRLHGGERSAGRPGAVRINASDHCIGSMHRQNGRGREQRRRGVAVGIPPFSPSASHCGAGGGAANAKAIPAYAGICDQPCRFRLTARQGCLGERSAKLYVAPV